MHFDMEQCVQAQEENLKTVTANQQCLTNQQEYIFGCASSSSPYAIPAGIFPQVTSNQCAFPPSAYQSSMTPVFRRNLPYTSFHDSNMTDADLSIGEQDAINITASQRPEPFGLHHTHNNTPLPSSPIAKIHSCHLKRFSATNQGKNYWWKRLVQLAKS